MAIALFPLIDGETVGSNFARYREFMGAENTLALRRRLFGYPCRPDTRIPSGVNHLADQTKDYWHLDAKEIVKRGTEFYYATASMSLTQRESMLSDMLEQPGNRNLRRSVGGWGAEHVAKFRYCEDCLTQWRECGTPEHWMVDHRLPGVYVCPVHSRMLKVAKRGIPQNFTDSTVMALKDVEDEEILARASSSELAAFADVAKLSAQYRMADRSVPSTSMYRQLLRTGGYTWLSGGVDIRALTASIVEYYGQEYCRLTGLSLNRLATWLRNIEVDLEGGESSHPFMFISVGSLLNNRCASPRSFIPAIRNKDAEMPTANLAEDSGQNGGGLQCKGFLHRANDVWQEGLSDCRERKLVCSCGVTYGVSKVGRTVEPDISVMIYGERYRNLISMLFADNFIVGSNAQRIPLINPRFSRWARFCGFSKHEKVSAEKIQDLRDRWSAVVNSARSDRRIMLSYQVEPGLYRTLYRYDRDWIFEFNKKTRARNSIIRSVVQ